MPHFHPVSISGYHIREAGATAVQELAFTLADGLGYVQAAIDRGLAVDDFAPRLSFFFNAHNHLFEEVAKFRAARRLWATLMAERFAPRDPRSLMLRFHTQTGGSTLQARQVDVNVVRVTVQAMAAVLGGTQSLHTNGRDEALNLPSEEAAVLALRTQQVLAHESGVTDVIDPLGGCPYVEALTDAVEAEARRLIERIDALGGTLAAVEAGFPQQQIEKSAYEAQRRIESGEDVIVGVNRFEDADDEAAPGTFEIDPAMEARAVERVRALRDARDGGAAAGAFEALADAVAGEENLLPAVLAAVEAGGTIGEVMRVLESRYGTFLAPAR
jgi:methylmalonyl-CoA mutase N-terminal domain/subunit